jgi:LemA protein
MCRQRGGSLPAVLGVAGLVIVVVGLGALLLVGWYVATRNSLIAQREAVRGSWGQVENVYQRRADLVPNLVETVKGYAAHESAVFIAVTEARAKATQIRVDPSDAASLQAFQRTQGELSSALMRLLAVAENYPDLKAGELFRDLMAQLEGTENRIAVERKRWNDAVLAFNTSIQMFPASWVAGRLGMTPLAYFEADEGAEKAPKVSF